MVSEIGFNIRNLRQKRRMSQEQLAKRLNISKSMVSGHERRKYIPSAEYLYQLAMIFDTTVDSLLGLNNRRFLNIDGLTEGQENLIHALIDICRKLQVQVGHLHGTTKWIRASVSMGAAGFHPGRCCRSLRLRKQSRGTHQTVPPGYGSPASCEAVRFIHQLQPGYTRQRKPQWTRPSERRLGTARCDVRFGDVPTRCIRRRHKTTTCVL